MEATFIYFRLAAEDVRRCVNVESSDVNDSRSGLILHVHPERGVAVALDEAAAAGQAIGQKAQQELGRRRVQHDHGHADDFLLVGQRRFRPQMFLFARHLRTRQLPVGQNCSSARVSQKTFGQFILSPDKEWDVTYRDAAVF